MHVRTACIKLCLVVEKQTDQSQEHQGVARSMKRIYVAVALAAAAISAQAAIIFDRSPDAVDSAIKIGNFLNVANDPALPQWFAERLVLSNSATLTGMDIFGNSYSSNALGKNVLIRIWAGTTEAPAELLFKGQSVISAFDKDGTASEAALTRRFAALTTPFDLAANRIYWVSMAGLTEADNVSLASYQMADDGGMWLGRWGDKPSGFGSFTGDMAFRLHGNTVPTPATPPLVVGALVMLSIAKKTRKSNKDAARESGHESLRPNGNRSLGSA